MRRRPRKSTQQSNADLNSCKTPRATIPTTVSAFPATIRHCRCSRWSPHETGDFPLMTSCSKTKPNSVASFTTQESTRSEKVREWGGQSMSASYALWTFDLGETGRKRHDGCIRQLPAEETDCGGELENADTAPADGRNRYHPDVSRSLLHGSLFPVEPTSRSRLATRKSGSLEQRQYRRKGTIFNCSPQRGLARQRKRSQSCARLC